jgi:hypothetical protein
MKLKKITVAMSFMLALVFWLSVSPCRTEDATIIGEVNDTQQVVANGQIYEVANNKAGDDLVANYISAKVKILGTIEEKEDIKIIHVISFEVVPE